MGSALLTFVPLSLFAGAAWIARWVRPSGDEWCFLPRVRDEGFMALVDKFYSMDNGRIANGFLVASYSSFGVPGQQWYAGISAIVMLALLWAWTAALRRTSGWHVPRGVPLFSAAMILALFCFASTNTYKTFFWPASSVSHTFPPVLAAATTIPALLATSRRGRAFAVASACVVGTVMGTLSEETSVVALTLLVLTMLLARRLFPSGRLAFVQAWCVSAAGALCSALQYSSPPPAHGTGARTTMRGPCSPPSRSRHRCGGTCTFF